MKSTIEKIFLEVLRINIIWRPGFTQFIITHQLKLFYSILKEIFPLWTSKISQIMIQSFTATFCTINSFTTRQPKLLLTLSAMNFVHQYIWFFQKLRTSRI